jgi:catechol 2,3-dioxygenase
MTSVIHPETTVGIVALSVGNLARSLDYYQSQIGLKVLSQSADTATLGVDTPLLRLTEVPGARVVRRATGLYHFALRVPTRHDLALVIRHFAEQQTPVSGASDHLFSEALYLSDPDGHGIEVYRDRPRDTWYDAQNNLRGGTDPLRIQEILGELDGNEPAWSGLPSGTDMGHIHLQIADIAAADRFYLGGIGFEKMMAMPSASFVSAGGYHHHVGMNTWAGVGVPAPPEGAAHLLSYELQLPNTTALTEVRDRLARATIPFTEQADGLAVRDPSQNLVLLRLAA